MPVTESCLTLKFNC